MPALSDDEKLQTQEVKGCENRVWIGALLNDDETFHFGDSEGRVVKGLFTILLAAIEQKTAKEIMEIDFNNLLAQTGLPSQLSESRQMVFNHSLRQFKNIANEMTPA